MPPLHRYPLIRDEQQRAFEGEEVDPQFPEAVIQDLDHPVAFPQNIALGRHQYRRVHGFHQFHFRILVNISLFEAFQPRLFKARQKLGLGNFSIGFYFH